MLLLVMGRATAERYQPGAGEVCVSITTPGDRPAELSPAFADVCRLSFADYPWDDTPEDRAKQAQVSIQPGDAARVGAFIARHMTTARVCVVHCMVGVSRSPALARGIRAGIERIALVVAREGVRLPAVTTRARRSDGREEPLGSRMGNRHVYVTTGRAVAEHVRETVDVLPRPSRLLLPPESTR